MFCILFSSGKSVILSESPPTNFMREGRIVDVVSTPMKEAQGILNLVLQLGGQCIVTTHEVVCTLIQK
jgi:hypothetical protein